MLLVLHLMHDNVVTKQCGEGSKQTNPLSNAIHHKICNTIVACHSLCKSVLFSVLAQMDVRCCINKWWEFAHKLLLQ
jgi:hypothetical protein